MKWKHFIGAFIASQILLYLFSKRKRDYTIPEDVKELMGLTDSYLIGGAVRDMVADKDKEIYDHDLTTHHTPDEIRKILEENNYKVNELGAKFGTMTTNLEHSGQVEITTFRSEEYSKGSRKPEVEFGTDLKEDLSRRDFTINALAMDVNGNITDLFGGIKDIKKGRLRFIGNPLMRIIEDPLRMIRFCRFTDYNPDPDVVKLLKEHSDLIDNIPVERIVDEIFKARNNFYKFIDRLERTGIAPKIFGKWIKDAKKITHDNRGTHYGESVWQHTLDVIDDLDDKNANLPTKLAGLFHDAGNESARIAREQLKKLRSVPKNVIRQVTWMVKNYMRIPEMPHNSLIKNTIDWRLNKIPERYFEDIQKLTEAVSQQNLQEKFNIIHAVYDVPRPDGRDFLKYPPRRRGDLIRDKWIDNAHRLIE